MKQLAGEGSNLQPSDPKSAVLPVELPANRLRGGPDWVRRHSEQQTTVVHT